MTKKAPGVFRCFLFGYGSLISNDMPDEIVIQLSHKDESVTSISEGHTTVSQG